MYTAIDFGISNIDAVACVDGVLGRWAQPSDSAPTPDLVRTVLAAGGVDLGSLRQLAVTGGRHRALPTHIGDCRVSGVGEIQAIGCGGQTLVMLAGGDG